MANDTQFFVSNQGGSIRFSDEPPHQKDYTIKKLPKEDKVLLSFTEVKPQAKNHSWVQIPKAQIQELITRSSQRHKVDPNLVKAVMKAESAYKVGAVSHKGASGLMQLMPQTAKGLGVNDIFDPAQNIDGGTKLLSKLLDHYNGNLDFVLSAYNAGTQAVKKYQGIPPYPETIDYVSKVRKYLQGFQHASASSTFSTF